MNAFLTRRHVLLAENNRDDSRSVSALLEPEEFDVEAVYDRRDSVVTEFAFRPEILLLDIGLPGMDGYNVAERLRGEAALNGVFKIAISDYDADAYPARSRRAGFDHHLVKPIDFDDLMPVIGTKYAPGELRWTR
jgi:two-component system, chemotaxis family, CheB/CheR fusion protein